MGNISVSLLASACTYMYNISMANQSVTVPIYASTHKTNIANQSMTLPESVCSQMTNMGNNQSVTLPSPVCTHKTNNRANHYKTLPVAICTHRHLVHEHANNNHILYMNVHVNENVVNHIRKRHGPIRPRNINLGSRQKKNEKMTRASENTISSEKFMHFTCFPRLSI